MKNYMKYFLLMGLVSVASAAEVLEEPEPAMRLTSDRSTYEGIM